jgi:hypothetical protein
MMLRFLPLLAVAAIAGCAGFGGPQKLSGDENQVVLNRADQQKAQEHCASFGKDAINIGQVSGSGNVTYACRPRRT